MSPIRIGIIYKQHFEPAKTEAKKLHRWLRKKGIAVYLEELHAEEGEKGFPSALPGMPEDLDWLVVLGGDGTLLRAARVVGKHGVPILGVNLGGLGFLTEIPLKRLYAAVEMLLEGELEIESRLMLEAYVLRKAEEICRFQALNDVVINKGSLARIIDLAVYINDEFLTTFRADGLIVSTPTGSTAYNLSAGGPILYPTMRNVILTPICPFTLTNRPIILPDSHRVIIRLAREIEERVSLTCDGQVGFEFLYGDKLVIHKSRKRIRLIKSPDQDYFEILRKKLMWGGATYNNQDVHK